MQTLSYVGYSYTVNVYQLYRSHAHLIARSNITLYNRRPKTYSLREEYRVSGRLFSRLREAVINIITRLYREEVKEEVKI